MPEPPEPLVKICGLSTPPTLEAAISAGADMVGLVHFPPSPRHVSLATAVTLAGKTRGRVDVVVLTVDPDDDLVRGIDSDLKPDWIQLQGKETPERVSAIRELARARVMKAVGIRDADDLDTVASYRDVADLLLLDAKPPRDATRPGGLGAMFDWSLLAALDAETRYVLAGGLTPDTVGEALTQTVAIGVDVSSGVEVAPGVKDIALIDAFVRRAKEARQGTATIPVSA